MNKNGRKRERKEGRRIEKRKRKVDECILSSPLSFLYGFAS